MFKLNNPQIGLANCFVEAKEQEQKTRPPFCTCMVLGIKFA
jgi:hypothetical protein